jgi:ABC-2 type transport system permease protein
MTFLAIARMAFFREAYYRFELFFNAVKAVVFVVVVAAVWRAVYAGRPSLGGLTMDEVIFYTCAAITLTLLYEVNLEREIGERLRTGNLALQLLKPVNYFLYGFAEGWGTVCYTALFSAVPTFVILALLFDLPAPRMSGLGAVLVMIVLGFTLFFAFCHLTALTTFFTIESWGVEHLRQTLVRFFAGGFVPLTLFPEPLYRLAMWLPFPYMVYWPARALTGTLPPERVAGTLAMQAFWCGVLLLVNYAYWKVIVRQVTVHGG